MVIFWFRLTWHSWTKPHRRIAAIPSGGKAVVSTSADPHQGNPYVVSYNTPCYGNTNQDH
jgi:hypothetical protein